MANKVNCDNCRESFKRSPSHVKDNNFCSNSCRGEWMSENISGKNNPSWKGGQIRSINCEQCGEEFERKKSHINYSGNNFCGRDCMTNYFWKGGSDSYRGRNWRYKRELVIKKDNEECVGCGMSREEHKEEYGQDLSVHHIIPFRLFSSAEDANRLNNLITLCTYHHQKIDAIVNRTMEVCSYGA